MIGDFYGDKWKPQPWYPGVYPGTAPQPQPSPVFIENISRAEFGALRKEVLDMKELLKRAKAYDEKNGEPDCEMETKMAILRKVAEAVGISLDDILKPTTAGAAKQP